MANKYFRIEWHSAAGPLLPLTLHNRNAIKTRIQNHVRSEREMWVAQKYLSSIRCYACRSFFVQCNFTSLLGMNIFLNGIFLFQFSLFYVIILWQNRSLGVCAVGLCFLLFISHYSHSFCAKIRKVLQKQTKLFFLKDALFFFFYSSCQAHP